jgi:hypothetical protein
MQAKRATNFRDAAAGQIRPDSSGAPNQKR